MQSEEHFVTLREGGEAKAVIAPHLGAWLLRYMRHLPTHGYVDALYFAQEVVERYPNQMYAGNPLLFPQVSYTHLPGKEHHYQWQGVTYPMPQHGFARRLKWNVIAINESSVAMELRNQGATEDVYPFQFRSEVRYSLEQGRLRFKQLVENHGNQVLPFSTGIHPYFPVPITVGGSRNNCFVELPDARLVRPVRDWEAWTAEPFIARELPVSTDVSGTLLLTDLSTPRVSLIDRTARLRITLDFADAPRHKFLAVWSKSPAEPFYCLEPWTALPNSFGRRETELILLEPGERFEAGMWISIEPY